MRIAALLAGMCLSISAVHGQQPMALTIVGDPSNHQLSWNTTSNYNYHVDCNSSRESYPHYFTVHVKSAASATFAADLVAHIVDEATATASNESFVGRESSSDEFLNATVSGLQIDSGVLLTTGDFTLWDDGDDGYYQDSEGEELHARGDFDLENRVAGTLTEDAAALEFDVFCPNGQLQFDYQFASEEYDEYVGEFNDAFMVTVDGAVVTWLPAESHQGHGSLRRGQRCRPAPRW